MRRVARDGSRRMTAVGRYCCKPLKLSGANFSALQKIQRRPLIRVPSIEYRRSPVSVSLGDEVPHIFARKSRVQPKEILMTREKGLSHQMRHEPEVTSRSTNVG